MNSKEHANKAEEIRKLIGAALCDFVGVLGESKDAFIVGGQYSRERLLVEFRSWLQDRNFNIAGSTLSSDKWVNLCNSHTFCGREGNDVTPTPTPKPKPPTPKPKPKPPKPKTKPPTPPPAGSSGVGEVFLNGDVLNGDDWKADEDKKDRWQDEGEDWKKGNEDD
jgi:hypothetical protein